RANDGSSCPGLYRGHSAPTGVRVPAIVVSPWVERQSVSNIVFDHTSIIKTILLSLQANGRADPRSGRTSQRRERPRLAVEPPRRPQDLTDLQREYLAAKAVVRSQGLP